MFRGYLLSCPFCTHIFLEEFFITLSVNMYFFSSTSCKVIRNRAVIERICEFNTTTFFNDLTQYITKLIYTNQNNTMHKHVLLSTAKITLQVIFLRQFPKHYDAPCTSALR